MSDQKNPEDPALASLSALMDGEADELAMRRALGAAEDAAVRAAWSRYHLASSLLRAEDVTPVGTLLLADRVQAALMPDEPVEQSAAWWKKSVAGLAVAASCAFLVVALQMQSTPTGQSVVAQDAPEQAKHLQKVAESTRAQSSSPSPEAMPAVRQRELEARQQHVAPVSLESGGAAGSVSLPAAQSGQSR